MCVATDIAIFNGIVIRNVLMTGGLEFEIKISGGGACGVSIE